ncbi:glycosyl hydrolase [Lineolata rhizophorae]|uniref:Vacuolar protein sorting/targeting protein 10 n=1 Tax=Lineolata rhizophorae TaxID=578093 RepID=A0A6A6P7L6_9PEZI|nr:glycosyl hydrolase [Lineolata rhizophorae]
MSALRRLLLPLLLLVAAALARPDPKVTEATFAVQPWKLLYFDDSEVVLFTDRDHGILHRSTAAGNAWEVVTDIPEGEVWEVFMHPYDRETAIVVGKAMDNWITHDQGATWRKFTTPETGSVSEPLIFHAGDPKRIIFNAYELCGFFTCMGNSYYTLDAFETPVEVLQKNRRACLWAKNDPLFSTGSDEKDKNRVLCIVEGRYSSDQKDYRMLISDDYFRANEFEPKIRDGRPVSGMINMANVKRYIVAAARAQGTEELALYVTDDTITWHKAEFGNYRIEEDAYTVLESTNYSVQIDVKTGKWVDMGVLYTSNSNGTYFTKNIEHTNRNALNFVDFEKIQNIQGIVLVNTVQNWEELEGTWSYAAKKVQSQISFDDGRTFQRLKVGDQDLHLHSITDQTNSGRVFSSPAPGIVMGVGNTGEHLKSYTEGDLFVSDDAGVTWKKALEEAHKYEFGDKGSILVAIYDEGETDKIQYSIDHGKNWTPAPLPARVRAQELTTIPDSTSLKFILVATKGGGSNLENAVYSIDFSALEERKCGDGDFETWHARVDGDGSPSCIMGHTQSFKRRKADADCFIKDKFHDPEPIFEDCDCTDADYECDFNFVRNDEGNCVLEGSLQAPEGACTNPDDTFMGSSGWRKIPGNTCIVRGDAKDAPIERPCTDTTGTTPSGEISHEITDFTADSFREWLYLERGDSGHGDDETILTLTDDTHDGRRLWMTSDHGKTWNTVEALAGENVLSIYPHQFSNDVVYIITDSSRVYYSKDRGDSFHYFEAPGSPTRENLQYLSFHARMSDWLIYTASEHCDFNGIDCHSTAHVTRNNGENWQALLPFVQKCQFVYREHRHNSEELVLCEQFRDENPRNPLELISSSDWFEHKTTHFDDVVNFATMSEFIVVAIKDPEDREFLRVDASIDGQTFAQAKFPHNFNVTHQKAYTVLDSSTHSVFLHVTVNFNEGQESGGIVKSNSNGTSYVLSIPDINRNGAGYVDFEKMLGLEGVAVVNVIANREEVDNGAPKRLRTKITHNDGADWTYLPAPKKDADNNNYNCGNDCSLHLHGYTERRDSRNTYSSPSAIGVMMGVGNVGPHLERIGDADTFMTTDGGVTWKAVMKGRYMWEYGDQGSVVVIVKYDVPTDHVFYTLDEGNTWKQYSFGREIKVQQISTVPSDTSLNFLLWGKYADGNKLATVNLDFSGLFERSCSLENAGSRDADYYLWEPRHPQGDSNCLFGHIAQYYRKKTDAPQQKCFNGRQYERLHTIKANCSCTRLDYECDYNFIRQNDNSCKLADGLDPLDPMAVCEENPDAFEYYDITGYRRIPITTCSGGLELELTSLPKPCPGHEDEFARKRGISGVGLFFAIVLPFAAAGAIGYYVWRNWDGKFGQIRLGDTRGYYSALDSDRPWIRWPVVAVSGLVAVVAALPMLASSAWRSVASRFGRGYGGRTYTSRSSFARGRGDYAVVDPDEGELLGEESDDEQQA